MGVSNIAALAASARSSADKAAMGVSNIWVIDLATQKGFDWYSGWHEHERFEADGRPIYLDLPTLFAELAK